MTNAIVPAGAHQVAITPDSRRALEPRSFEEAFKLARVTAASGMFGVKSPEEACVRIMTGVSLGLTAMQSLRGIHVVKGRPVLSADLMAAIALASGQCEYFDCEHTSADKAVYVTKRVGRPERRLEWTMAMAREVRVDGVPLTNKDVWKSYPGPMLRARCIAALARMVYPDLLLGVYTPEELAEQPPAAPMPDEVAVEVVAFAQSEGPATSRPPAARPSPTPEVDPFAELRAVCKTFPGGETTFKRSVKAVKAGQLELSDALLQARENAAMASHQAAAEEAAEIGGPEALHAVLARAKADKRLSVYGLSEVEKRVMALAEAPEPAPTAEGTLWRRHR